MAALLLDRLKQASTDQRIQESQFGFRPNRGTGDALFVARRMIDSALADRNGRLFLLLLER